MLSAGTVHGEFNSKFKVRRRRKNSVSAHSRTDLNGSSRCKRSAWWKGQHCGSQRPGGGRSTRTIPQQPGGSTVTIHEHLDGTVSIRYGPHVVAAIAPQEKASARHQRAPWKRRSMEAGDKTVSTAPTLP